MAINVETQLGGAVATSVNEQLFSAMVRHQIFIMRMAGSVRNDTVELLNKTEADIADKIRARLRTVHGPTPRNLRRAQRLVQEIRKIRGSAWGDVERFWQATFREFVGEEAAFNATALKTSVPVLVETVLPPAQTLRSLVTQKPFEGRVLGDWAKKIRDADLRRIEEQIKIGIVQGEPSAEIARRVVGTARLKGTDGVTQITRNNAAAITRTATNHFSNQARREFLELNSEFYKEEVYVATLDGRTTPICRSLDGQRFPVGQGSIPPLHFSCRSLRVAAVNGDVLGRRPAKPTTERGLLREYTDRQGITKVGARDALPRGHKGSFDKFKRKRIREMTGTVPAKVTYQEWLKTQSTEFQNDVLGTARAKLFRSGELDLKKFVNRTGDEIPLRDLAKTDAAAFKAAGLDPDDFK